MRERGTPKEAAAPGFWELRLNGSLRAHLSAAFHSAAPFLHLSVACLLGVLRASTRESIFVSICKQDAAKRSMLGFELNSSFNSSFDLL